MYLIFPPVSKWKILFFKILIIDGKCKVAQAVVLFRKEIYLPVSKLRAILVSAVLKLSTAWVSAVSKLSTVRVTAVSKMSTVRVNAVSKVNAVCANFFAFVGDCAESI